MDHSWITNFRKVVNSITLGWRTVATSIVFLYALFFIIPSSAQNFNREKDRSHKSEFRKQTRLYANACNILEKKRNKQYRKSSYARTKIRKPQTMAERGPSEAMAKAIKANRMGKPISKSLARTLKEENVSEDKIASLQRVR